MVITIRIDLYLCSLLFRTVLDEKSENHRKAHGKCDGFMEYLLSDRSGACNQLKYQQSEKYDDLNARFCEALT